MSTIITYLKLLFITYLNNVFEIFIRSLPSTDTGGMNSSIDDESMSSSTYGIKQDHRQINKIPTSVGTERKPRQKGESDAARDRRK